jgi:plasmid recombination enzyme
MRGGNKVGYAVVHMMKIKSGAVGGIQSHNNREHEPKTNPDVDMSRSEDNYDLIPCDNYKRSIKEKLSNLVESSRAVRKDAVVVCNFIVTSDNETMDALGADRQRELFQDSVKWFSDRYGADRVLNATVHMDETTPHLHIGVMPITQDGRLSAKAIFTKTEMKAIQTEFARDVGEKYGLERGAEGSERTHLSEARFKEQKALEMANEHGAIAQELQIIAEDCKQELSEATRSLETVKQELSAMQDRKDTLQDEIERLEAIDKQTKVRVHEALEKQKPVLLDLQKRISEAKSELSVIETAVKEKKAEGTEKFGWDGMAERIERARKEAGKDNRIKALEARISLLERFISLPQVKPLWEQFQALIGRKKPQKDHDSR